MIKPPPSIRNFLYITYVIALVPIILATLLGAKNGIIIFILLIWFGFIAVMEFAYHVEGEK